MSSPATAVGRTVAIHNHLDASTAERALRTEVAAGLRSDPKELSPKWLYDERGCDLFDQITRLDEYYPTRTERAILYRHADDIARRSGAQTLIELGSGTSEKTRLLLDALRRNGTLERFVGFDVAETTLVDAGQAILDEYPDIEVEGVVGDFEHHLGLLPRGGRRMIAFLGGTIGNLFPDGRRQLLHDLSAALESGDSVLIGTDLVKDTARLERAYDDESGVTAEFNKNVLAMINRELGGHFDLSRFEHVARFDTDDERIEMLLRAVGRQFVEIDQLGITVAFEDGEELRTEISTKFRVENFPTELTAAGFQAPVLFTDPRRDFALWLAAR